MKLIHTADLHLDSSLANFPAAQAKERRAELLESFRHMVEVADEQKISAILIAGDLFDSPRQIRKQTVKTVLETIARYPNIHFYYLAGNHDGGAVLFDGGESLPENLHTFPERWTSYRLENVVITAAQSPAPETLSLDPKDINILLLHGQALDTFSAAGTDEIPLRAYAGKGVDYLALGHYHSYTEYRVDDRAVACYSGTPEGRGFDECGPKGYVLLEVTPQKQIKRQFVPFAQRTLHEVRLDLSGCTRQSELESRAETALSGIPDSDLVKLTLCGEIDPDFEPEYLRVDRLLERFWFSRRKDESSPLIRPEDYRNDRSLKGEFIRLALTDESLTKEDRDAVIRLGLQALFGKEVDL